MRALNENSSAHLSRAHCGLLLSNHDCLLHLLHLASDVLLCHLHCLLLGGLSLDFLLLEYTEVMLPPLLEALLPLLLCQLLGHLGSLLLLLPTL